MLKPQMCPTAWLICQVPSIQQQSTKPTHNFSMFFLKVEYRGFHKGGYPNSWKRMETPINIWMILGGTPHDLGNLHMLGVSTCFFFQHSLWSRRPVKPEMIVAKGHVWAPLTDQQTWRFGKGPNDDFHIDLPMEWGMAGMECMDLGHGAM